MGTALKASSSGGGAVQNVNLTELGGPIEVTISGIGTLSNPVEQLSPGETASRLSRGER